MHSSAAADGPNPHRCGAFGAGGVSVRVCTCAVSSVDPVVLTHANQKVLQVSAVAAHCPCTLTCFLIRPSSGVRGSWQRAGGSGGVGGTGGTSQGHEQVMMRLADGALTRTATAFLEGGRRHGSRRHRLVNVSAGQTSAGTVPHWSLALALAGLLCSFGVPRTST